MTDQHTTGAPGFAPGAAGLPSTPHADIRAVAEEEIAFLLRGADIDVPPLRQLDVRTADRTIVRVALLRFAAQAYEDDDELAERLRQEIDNLRAARRAYEAQVIDDVHAAIRADRKKWANLPTFEELTARRRTYPPTRPMVQAPGWPAPVIPGSGGRRLNEPETGAA